jgi:hypothetical protein
MTDIRSAVTGTTRATNWRKRATQRQPSHSFERSIVARSRTFSFASSVPFASCASSTSSHFSALLPETGCRIEFAVSHSKQSTAIQATRNWNKGGAATDFFNPRSQFSFGAIKMERSFRHESH